MIDFNDLVTFLLIVIKRTWNHLKFSLENTGGSSKWRSASNRHYRLIGISFSRYQQDTTYVTHLCDGDGLGSMLLLLQEPKTYNGT